MGKAGLRRWLAWAIAVTGVLTLAACAAQAPAPPPPPPRPQAVAPPPPPPPPPPKPAPDQCGAADLQYLVGRPKVEIPIPLMPGHRRVVCATCPMTQDFVADRQTILFDPASGVVTSVKCG